MLTTGYSSWLWLAFYCLSLSICCAQSDSISNAGPASSPQSAPQTAAPSQTFQSTLLTFQQNQQALAQGLGALLIRNPTPQQMQAWQQQNATAIQNQQQLAIRLAATASYQPLPYITDVYLPAGATQQMSDFFATHADLANRYAEFYNQQLQSGSESSGVGNAATPFQQQNATEIQTQQQQAQVVAAQSAAQPMPTPPPLVIRPGTSSQLAAYLTAKDQLTRDQIAFANKYLTATPAAREAAMELWMKENSNRLQQMRALAQSLSSTTQN